MKKFISNITVASLAFLPFAASAVTTTNTTGGQIPPDLKAGLDQATSGIYGTNTNSSMNVGAIIINIVNWLLGFLGIAAVVLIIYGGVLWMTSGGEDKRAKQGKMVIKNAVIGLAIILAAYIIVNFVISAFTQVASKT